MKVSEFISICDKNGLEADIYDDYVDEIGIAYVGDEDTSLTEEGRKHFAEVLDMDISWGGKGHAVLEINKYPEAEADRKLALAKEFFNGCAGYMAISTYERYFVEK